MPTIVEILQKVGLPKAGGGTFTRSDAAAALIQLLRDSGMPEDELLDRVSNILNDSAGIIKRHKGREEPEENFTRAGVR